MPLQRTWGQATEPQVTRSPMGLFYKALERQGGVRSLWPSLTPAAGTAQAPNTHRDLRFTVYISGPESHMELDWTEGETPQDVRFPPLPCPHTPSSQGEHWEDVKNVR